MGIRVFAVALSATFALSACGGSAEPPPVSPGPPGQPDPPAPAAPPPGQSSGGSVELDSSPAIEEIKQRRKLMVGVRSDAPMFVDRGPSGEQHGFDVEIAKILAAGLDLKPETQVTLRALPPELQADSMASGNVDVQLGGVDPASPETATVGPYVVTEQSGDTTEHFIGFKPGDDAMRKEVQRIMDTAVADGSWQRAYDATLGAAGVQARPAP